MSTVIKIESHLKEPTETEDYLFDWSGELAEGDEVDPQNVTVTISGPDATLIKQSENPGTDNVRVMLSGGTDGANYKVTCTIGTTQGRISTYHFWVIVRDL